MRSGGRGVRDVIVRLLLRFMPWYDEPAATEREKQSADRRADAVRALESYRRVKQHS